MLENIKLLLGLADNSKDELLMLLIERCQDEFVNYTHNDNCCGTDSIISAMVVYQYNRLGTEGLNGESYSGVNFSYSSDYPDYLLREIKAFRKLKVC